MSILDTTFEKHKTLLIESLGASSNWEDSVDWSWLQNITPTNIKEAAPTAAPVIQIDVTPEFTQMLNTLPPAVKSSFERNKQILQSDLTTRLTRNIIINQTIRYHELKNNPQYISIVAGGSYRAIAYNDPKIKSQNPRSVHLTFIWIGGYAEVENSVKKYRKG